MNTMYRIPKIKFKINIMKNLLIILLTILSTNVFSQLKYMNNCDMVYKNDTTIIFTIKKSNDSISFNKDEIKRIFKFSDYINDKMCSINTFENGQYDLNMREIGEIGDYKFYYKCYSLGIEDNKINYNGNSIMFTNGINHFIFNVGSNKYEDVLTIHAKIYHKYDKPNTILKTIVHDVLK